MLRCLPSTTRAYLFPIPHQERTQEQKSRGRVEVGEGGGTGWGGVEGRGENADNCN